MFIARGTAGGHAKRVLAFHASKNELFSHPHLALIGSLGSWTLASMKEARRVMAVVDEALDDLR